MPDSKPHEDSVIWMSGTYDVQNLLLKRAIIREGFSKLTETTVEFQSKNKAVQLEKIVGKAIRLHVMTQGGAGPKPKPKERMFTGTCVSVESLGFHDGYGTYVAEVRPWFWMLTRTQDCRVFQDVTAVAIIEKLFSEHGFSSDYEIKITDTPAVRNYCVQYRESDYAFICRLMEEEGIYFYFKNDLDSPSTEKMVLCDGISGHSPIPEESTVEFHARDKNDRRREDHIAEWTLNETLTRGKVTLNDYDFTIKQDTDHKAADTFEKGSHSFKSYEVYDYPGHYRKENALGKKLAKVRMEAEAIRHKRWRGASSVRTLGTGRSFKMKDHPDTAFNAEYLVTDAVHYLQVDTDFKDTESRRDLTPQNLDFPEEVAGDAYANMFGVIPKNDQFRAPLITPWPQISGLQTATVVGKKGEEIWTDKYGRIKVQFHWDREGEDNENSSCWVRTAMPWTGNKFGFIAIPRIGYEVVIQFEEGDPDRPICTGMLYNADNMPPYELPTDQTQSGLKTDSTKGVSESTAYNELMFEDKAGEELMRIQAQKDHQALIKNKSVITIGQPDIQAEDHDEEGSLSQTVRNHVSETIQEGNHYETIKEGNHIETIAKGDHTFKIETGSQEIEIKKNRTQTIEGKHTKTITGNDATTVKSGNMTVNVSMGKISMEAMQEISLKVGASTITIKPAEISIKSPIIKITADGMAEMKSPMTTVKGDGMLTLKGGITMIN